MKSISGTITSGGVAQVLYNPQGQSYKGWFLRNNSSLSLYVDENGSAIAAQPSLEIKSGELYESPPNAPLFVEQLSIIGSTTNQAFTARVW